MLDKSKTDDASHTKLQVEKKYSLGKSQIFTPEVINDIHIKSELGRYRMRGFSLFKKIPHWDDLTFLPGTLTRFVIEGYREKCLTKTIIGPKAKRPLELDIPIYVTGMSFGALSFEAKTALARGATMAGTATCSGEGGMIPDERRYSSKWLYQCIQSRYGFNPHHLQLADACEFFIGQGCKVGLGGHLMGQKVTDQVAEMRSLPAGIDQRSPARHPDWLGPDDLALKINEIREATDGQIPIQLKLVLRVFTMMYVWRQKPGLTRYILTAWKVQLALVLIWQQRKRVYPVWLRYARREGQLTTSACVVKFPWFMQGELEMVVMWPKHLRWARML